MKTEHRPTSKNNYKTVISGLPHTHNDIKTSPKKLKMHLMWSLVKGFPTQFLKDLNL